MEKKVGIHVVLAVIAVGFYVLFVTLLHYDIASLNKHQVILGPRFIPSCATVEGF